MHAIEELFYIGLSCCVTFTLNFLCHYGHCSLCLLLCLLHIYCYHSYSLSLLKNSYLSGCAVCEVIFLYSTMIGTSVYKVQVIKYIYIYILFLISISFTFRIRYSHLRSVTLYTHTHTHTPFLCSFRWCNFFISKNYPHTY